MNMSDHLNHLKSIWYHSEPLEVSYVLNRFLGWDFFVVSYNKPALRKHFQEIFGPIELYLYSSGFLTTRKIRILHAIWYVDFQI